MIDSRYFLTECTFILTLQISKKPVVAVSHIWRIWHVRKQFEALFIQFDYRFHRLVERWIIFVEQHFFLLHVRPFFLDFCAKSIQHCHLIVAVNGFTFLKIVDKQNTMGVPKYECHNLTSPLLSFWSLWTAFTSCCPLS